MSANQTVRGHVYCLAIDAQPGTVKIGATTRDPNERLREANACTWSPWPFRLVVAAEVPDVWATERLLHALLSARRTNYRHEFFTLTPDEACGLFAVLAPPIPLHHVAPSVPCPTRASRSGRRTLAQSSRLYRRTACTREGPRENQARANESVPPIHRLSQLGRHSERSVSSPVKRKDAAKPYDKSANSDIPFHHFAF